jgi:hypothetical protein
LLWAKKFGRSAGEVKKGVGDEASTAEVVNSEPVERLRFVDIVAVKRLVMRVPEWIRVTAPGSASKRKWKHRGTRAFPACVTRYHMKLLTFSSSPLIDDLMAYREGDTQSKIHQVIVLVL